MDNIGEEFPENAPENASPSAELPEMPPQEIDPAPASKVMFFIALAVGAIGIVTGAIGIYMGNSASSELAAYKKLVASKPDATDQFKKDIKSIDDRLARVGSEVVRANNGIRDVKSDFQRALQTLSGDISSNRTQLNKLTSAMTDRNSRPTSTKHSSTSTASLGSSSPSSTTSTSSSSATYTRSPLPDQPLTTADGQIIHVIEKGDYFGKLAKQYGVTTQDIIDANPDANPNRLQLGQRIVIPVRR